MFKVSEVAVTDAIHVEHVHRELCYSCIIVIVVNAQSLISLCLPSVCVLFRLTSLKMVMELHVNITVSWILSSGDSANFYSVRM